MSRLRSPDFDYGRDGAASFQAAADNMVLALELRGIKPVIPPKANRLIQRNCDFALYCERNLVERFFNILKHFRAIATRYDKLARNFLAAVQLVGAIILLN
jgi:transposase